MSTSNVAGGRSPLADLPAAVTGEVRLRFAPEPSGFLHIGHAKAALLNQEYASRYQGHLILRFDDTNPLKESQEFVENILRDTATLGLRYEEVTYTSDYFHDLMKMAERLIQEGKAYVDDAPKESKQDDRFLGIESKCRSNTVEQNLELWGEMVRGSVKGLQCCLRGKLDMKSPNKCLRDPVYYRCVAKPHHRIESQQFNVYPTYDFACPFVDSVQGITHALRSSEYTDRNPLYHRIQEDMGLRKVHVVEISRLNLAFTPLSKRHLKFFVQNGMVEGWDDPRLPTVQGIIRRGLKVDALTQFVAQLGASKNQNLMEWDKIWAINRKLIDPECPRHTAVNLEGRVLLVLTNGPLKPVDEMVPLKKKHDGEGLMKTLTKTSAIWVDQVDAKSISLHEEITLMDWGNCIIRQILEDQNGNISKLIGDLHPQGDFRATKLKVTWLPDTSDLVNLSLLHFDYLLQERSLFSNKKKKNIKMKKEDDSLEQDFLNAINPCTKQEVAALGDSNMTKLKKGDRLQLERKGYYICDVPFDASSSSNPIVLFAIPDGRQPNLPK